MVIIAECGATKSAWTAAGRGGEVLLRTKGPALNVSTMDAESTLAVLEDCLRTVMQESGGQRVSSVHLYVAGVLTPAISASLREAAAAVTGAREVEVQSDFTAAVRAVCGHGPGIMAILGTGSNSCQWDGERVVKWIHSGGYVLGDEGSAATLGRLFLSDVIKGAAPSELVAEMSGEGHDTSYEGIVGSVYHSDGSPSGFLGSLAPLVVRHYNDCAYARNLVDGNFRAFIDRCLLQYDTDALPVGVVGGFGYACRDIFTPLAQAAGVKISGYFPNPIEQLVAYHCL